MLTVHSAHTGTVGTVELIDYRIQLGFWSRFQHIRGNMKNMRKEDYDNDGLQSPSADCTLFFEDASSDAYVERLVNI